MAQAAHGSAPDIAGTGLANPASTDEFTAAVAERITAGH